MTKLKDLAEWQVLRFTCERCKYTVLMDPKLLARKHRLAWDADIAPLEPRLRCSKCLAKGTSKIDVGPNYIGR